MAVILNLASNQPPSSVASGSWPATMANGRWKFSFTPTVASASWPADHYEVLFGWPNAAQGPFLGKDGANVFLVIGDDDGAGYVELGRRALTFSASQTVTVEFNMPAGTFTISGATTGNGTETLAGGAWSYPTTGTLYIGQDSTGAFPFSGTFSNVEDFAASSIAGTSAGSATAAATLTGAGGGGGGSSLRARADWTRDNFRPVPGIASPAPIGPIGTNFTGMGLSFASTADQACCVTFKASGYTGGSLFLEVAWYAATATSGVVRWGGAASAITPDADTQDVETDSFASESTVDDSHLGTTARRLHKCTLEITNVDGLAAGDWVTVRLARRVSVGSNMSGGAILESVLLSYA